MKPRTRCLFAASFVFAMTQASHGASGTWDGSTDGTWHDGTNWSSNAVPNAAADIATFDANVANTTVSIGSTTTTVDRINFSGASVAAYTFTGTGSTNMVMSTNGGGVFIDSAVTTAQDLSGIPIIRPGMGDTINFSNQGSGLLKLGTFQAQNNSDGSLSTLNFAPGANGKIEIVSGKSIDNAGTGGSKKIAIILDDVGTLRIAATGSYDGTNAEGNSVSIRRGTLEAAVIKNSGTISSLGGGGRIQFGQAGQTYTATLDYYGASDTTNRDFYIIDNNTAVFKVSGGSSTNLAITSAITQSGSASGGGKLTKDGVGILTLSGDNSYSGQTRIDAGRLVAAHVNALGSAGSFARRTTINTGGTLELATDTSVAAEHLDILSNNSGAVVVNRATAGAGITHSMGVTLLGSNSTLNVTKGTNVTSGTATLGTAGVTLASGSVGTGTLNADTAAISVTGGVSSGVAFAKTLELTGSHTESAISGAISNGSGTVSLTKSGSGTWTLSNAGNTYTGDTTVSGGTLALSGNGSIANSALIDVQGSGTLSIAGVATSTTIGGATAQTLKGTGKIDLGAKPMTVGANGTLAPGASAGTLEFIASAGGKLDFASGSEIQFELGTSSDLLKFSSAGDWLSGTGNATLALTLLGGFDYSNTYTIFQNVTTTSFNFFDITGYDEVNYTANFAQSGTDYNLSFTPVPEPRAALLGSLGMLLLLRRRR